MKRLMFVLVGLLIFNVSAYAQMSSGMMGSRQSQVDQGMSRGQSQQMCPMMGQDMMQMMMDMMNMQEKMMMGVKADEKKKMMKDMTQMKGKMQNMMSMCKGMMGGGMMGQPSGNAQCRMNCAEQWLKKAIDVHDMHLKDPKTATEASQMEMMEQMKKAYDCITGAGSEMCGAPLKEQEIIETEKKAPSKKDPHGH